MEDCVDALCCVSELIEDKISPILHICLEDGCDSDDKAIIPLLEHQVARVAQARRDGMSTAVLCLTQEQRAKIRAAGEKEANARRVFVTFNGRVICSLGTFSTQEQDCIGYTY